LASEWSVYNASGGRALSLPNGQLCSVRLLWRKLHVQNGRVVVVGARSR